MPEENSVEWASVSGGMCARGLLDPVAIPLMGLRKPNRTGIDHDLYVYVSSMLRRESRMVKLP